MSRTASWALKSIPASFVKIPRIKGHARSRIRLTSQGEEIRYYAENALKNASLIHEICLDHTDRSLKLAVNSSSRLAYSCSEYFLEHMEEGMNLRYKECSTEEMLDLLQRQNYDLGILFVPADKKTALDHMIRRRHLNYTELMTSDLVMHSGPGCPFYGRNLISPEELDQCSCIQLEDDFFSVSDLLMTHKAFHSGKCRIKKIIQTNSDHLMIRMLQKTNLCNIGSYWLKSSRESSPFSISVIDGFQGKVSFGYLTRSEKELSKEARDFLLGLQHLINISKEEFPFQA